MFEPDVDPGKKWLEQHQQLPHQAQTQLSMVPHQTKTQQRWLRIATTLSLSHQLRPLHMQAVLHLEHHLCLSHSTTHLISWQYCFTHYQIPSTRMTLQAENIFWN